MPTMISDEGKRVLGKLLDDYNDSPWYKKLFYPRALGDALRQYNKEAPSLDTANAIYNAYVNKTWFFQRWFFSSLVSFSRSSLGAELKTLNETRPLTSEELPDEEQPVTPNRLEQLPVKLLEMVASHLSQQDVGQLAKSDRRFNSIFQEPLLFGKFLECIAFGQQEKAERLLSHVFEGQQEKIQAALQYQGTFTDYSGRTFRNCTAYEYAYWAKDTHMCGMLESHMDNATKAVLLKRIDAMEGDGLTYEQHGVVMHSKHFDFTPLITALRSYVDGYKNWYATNNWAASNAAWMEVGIKQRDMPVHVLNEYCHPGRSFYPRPEFNEEDLPRSVRFYNYNTSSGAALFPLVISDSSGLGVDFALIRSGGPVGGRRCPRRGAEAGIVVRGAACDLAAVSRLDVVRDEDLTRSRKNLQPTDQVLNHSMRV